MILTLIFFLFVSISIMLGWFCYKLVYRLNYVSENMNELYTRLDEFDQHINFIYELELYYGDETLKNLIRHSRDLRNYMKNYREIMEALEDGNEVIDDGQNTNEDEAEESFAEDEQKTTTTGKTLFYQGP